MWKIVDNRDGIWKGVFAATSRYAFSFMKLIPADGAGFKCIILKYIVGVVLSK